MAAFFVSVEEERKAMDEEGKKKNERKENPEIVGHRLTKS